MAGGHQPAETQTSILLRLLLECVRAKTHNPPATHTRNTHRNTQKGHRVRIIRHPTDQHVCSKSKRELKIKPENWSRPHTLSVHTNLSFSFNMKLTFSRWRCSLQLAALTTVTLPHPAGPWSRTVHRAKEELQLHKTLTSPIT